MHCTGVLLLCGYLSQCILVYRPSRIKHNNTIAVGIHYAHLKTTGNRFWIDGTVLTWTYVQYVTPGLRNKMDLSKAVYVLDYRGGTVYCDVTSVYTFTVGLYIFPSKRGTT